jgi:hypothetical protein
MVEDALIRRVKCTIAALAVLTACDPFPNVGGVHRSDTTSHTVAPLPLSLTCNGDVRFPIVAAVRLEAPAPPTPGQPTEMCYQAKRLYDAERWESALATFRSVADGETGDDEGNRQIAQYRVAIALFRLKRFAESAAVFHLIARNRDHLKHNEALLWIATFAFEHPESFDLGDLAFYDRDDIGRFANANQRDTWAGLSYLLGRARLGAGAQAEARDLFAQVPPEHRYYGDARRCLGGL